LKKFPNISFEMLAEGVMVKYCRPFNGMIIRATRVIHWGALEGHHNPLLQELEECHAAGEAAYAKIKKESGLTASEL
jgi:hypothetical protein